MSEPFFLNLGTARNQNELDKLYEPFQKEFDLAYFCTATINRHAEHRLWVEEMWKDFEPFSDPDFLIEARKSAYHQRMWEMYLGSTLLKKGFQLLNLPGSEHPDLCIEQNEEKIWIECIAGTRGDVPEYENGYSGKIDILDDPKVLRITSNLSTKNSQINKYISDGLIGENDSVLIAINGGLYDCGLSTERLYMKALYGFHAITYNFETKKSGNTSRIEVNNHNNSPVIVQPFLSKQYENIAGVIFCGDTLINSSKSKAGSNLALIHNAKAKNPLEHGVFQFGIEHYYDPSDSTVKAQVWDKET